MKDDSRISQRDALPSSQARALDAAFRILARRDHTSRELMVKLRRKGIGRPAVDAALQRCRELGYLDDAKTARVMADQLAGRGYGPLRIRRTLMQKGIEDRLVEQVLGDCSDEEAQRTMARTLLEKKASRFKRESDPKGSIRPLRK